MKKITLIIMLLLLPLVLGYDGYSRFDNLWNRGWLNVTGTLNVSDDSFINGDLSVGNGALILDIYFADNFVRFNTTSPINFNNSICLNEICVDNWDDINLSGSDTNDTTRVDAIILNYWNMTATLLNFTNLTVCADNEIIKMDGASWNCEADADTGGAGAGDKWTDEGDFISPNTTFADNIVIPGYIKSNNWTNVSIIETQISDLVHTVDTNYSGCSDGEYGDGINDCIPFNFTVQDLSLNKTEADGFYLNLTGKNADQNINITPFTLITIDPTLDPHVATKGYVDNAVSGTTFDFFLTNHTSDIATYNNLTESFETEDIESNLVSPTITTADDQLIFNYSTRIGQPEFDALIGGIYDLHVHLQKTTGTKVVTVYWTLSNRTGTTETLILTSETSGSIALSQSAYELHGVLNNEIMLLDGDRLVLKIYANGASGGSNAEVTVFMEGTTDSHFTVRTTTNAFERIFLRRDGTTNFTGNLNQGNINFTNLGSWFLGITNWSKVDGRPTALSEFSDDLVHVEDNTSFNKTLTDVLYLPHTTDTNETSRMDNVTGLNCTGTDKITGRFLNGTAICAVDIDTWASNVSNYYNTTIVDSLITGNISNHETTFKHGNTTAEFQAVAVGGDTSGTVGTISVIDTQGLSAGNITSGELLDVRVVDDLTLNTSSVANFQNNITLNGTSITYVTRIEGNSYIIRSQ